MKSFALIGMLVVSWSVATAELESDIDSYLAPYLETNNFQGVVLVAKDDNVLMNRGFGLASIEHSAANTPETVFHIASVSKPFTALAVVLLANDFGLSLDAPIGRYVPEYAHAENVTLHHLLSHTSGIPNINGLEEYGEIQLHQQTPQSLFEFFKDLPLDFVPGSKYGYSNSNYNLLAFIIERVSGRSFGEYLEEKVIAPAGVGTIAHDSDPSSIISHRADGYAPDGLFGVRRAPWLNWTAKTGNGSLMATAEDLFVWSRAFFDGDIVPSADRERMLTEHTNNVGYGWFVVPRHGRPQFHINGRSPGFSSYLGYYPREKLTIVVLSNLYNSIPTSIGTDLAAMALGLPYNVPRVHADPLAKEFAAGIAGKFQYGPDFYNPGVVVTLEVREGFIFQRWGNEGVESALIPQGDDTFIDRAFWSEVALIRDEDGVVTEVRFDGFAATRVD